MVRTYFNEKAVIWDKEIAEKDITKLKSMAQRLNLKPNSMVLDIGTGTGVFVPFLLNKIGANGRLVAVDIAEEMLKLARAKNFPANIEHIHADVVNLPIARETFNAAVCYSSFPHFRDKSKALTEISRVLRRGGGLFICHTSNRSVINAIHSELPAVQHDLVPDAESMRQLLSTAGFGTITIEDNADSYLASAIKP